MTNEENDLTADPEPQEPAHNGDVNGPVDDDKSQDNPPQPEVGGEMDLEGLRLPDEYAAHEGQLAAFRDLARDLNLPRESAQALVDFELDRLGRAQADQETRWQETMADWLQAAQQDAEIGGVAFDRKVSDARMAFNAFGDEELLRLVSPPGQDNPGGLGIGNHPALLRFCYRISQQISPDRFIPSNQQSGGMKTAAEILYPTKE